MTIVVATDNVLQELSANQSGEMRLRVESEQVTVSTHFRDLENPEWGKPLNSTCMIYTEHQKKLITS